MTPSDHSTPAPASTSDASEPGRLRLFTPAGGALLGLAGWLVWRPAESFPGSAVLTTVAVLVLAVWAWRRTSPAAERSWWLAGGVLALLVAAGAVGCDPSAAFTEAALAAAVAAVIWIASREAPPERLPAILALIISGLAVWGVLQLTAGPAHIEAVLAQLPEHLRQAAAERLTSGRAFASQPLPSHLAVMFATALPLLLARLRLRWSALVWLAGAVLCFVGLAATRSPIGVGLALAACAALAAVLGGRAVRLSVAALAAVLVLVVAVRGDVLELEPFSLRFDNWRTAVWVWSTAPAAGVGFGGFAQAAQEVPFAVGNRPRHAHSLPLEWLAELGPIGLLAVLIAGVSFWRLLRDLWPRRPDLAVAITVVPVHNLVDFSLFGSGVALPWAVLVGWALAVRGPHPPPGNGPRGRTLAVTAATLALAVTGLHTTSIIVGEAAARQAGPEERFAGAFEARKLAPWRSETLPPLAIAALESGDSMTISAAAAELERARWLRPRSAALADLRSRLALALGQGPTAAAEAWAADRLHPADPEYRNALTRLLDRLQRSGDAATR